MYWNANTVALSTSRMSTWFGKHDELQPAARLTAAAAGLPRKRKVHNMYLHEGKLTVAGAGALWPCSATVGTTASAFTGCTSAVTASAAVYCLQAPQDHIRRIAATG